MIYIFINPSDFEYDVMSLVQAIFPGEEFKVNKEYEGNSSDSRAVSCDEKILRINLLGDTINIEFECGENTYTKSVECKYQGRRKIKNVLKKAVYILLCEATGKNLPWGNLTGIRPAKIPALLMAQGLSENEIMEQMREDYLISEDKLQLSIDIAKKERQVLEDIPYKNGYSLYIGIPFCPTTCLYCSFTSYPIGLYKSVTDEYVSSMVKEMEYLGGALKGIPLNSVYIGGGTPTTLEPYQLERIIIELKNNFDFSNVVEFTVEAGRPDSITEDKLRVLKKNGVDRISINPQTMNQDTLDLIGRRHTVEDVIEKFHLARKCGFDNINMDLILGLPQEDEDKVRHTLEEILKLSPDSLTVHSLAVKRAARLNVQKEKYENMKMVNDTKMMDLAYEYAAQMGMKPYYLYRQKNMAGNQENVGYSVNMKEGIYNMLMMGDKQNIIAIGAGATTKMMSKDRLSATRIDNVKNAKDYIERIDEMIERKKKYLESNEFYIE